MKLSDKLAKVDDSLSVNRFDNGYVVEVGGQNKNDDWVSAKIVCNTLAEVHALLDEYSTMPRN